jgi:hypothetical protein
VYHTALSPPSRFSTQLLAYWLVARNTAAWAISSGVPNRFCGIDSSASERATSVMSVLKVIIVSKVNYRRLRNTFNHSGSDIPWNNRIDPDIRGC